MKKIVIISLVALFLGLLIIGLIYGSGQVSPNTILDNLNLYVTKSENGITIFSTFGKRINHIEKLDTSLLSSYKKVNLDLDVTGLEIRLAKSNEIPRIEYFNAFDKDGNLLIKSEIVEKDGQVDIRVKNNQVINRDSQYYSFEDDIKTLIVLPASTSLDKLEINLEIGSVSLDSLQVKELQVRLSLGDLALIKSDIKSGKIDLDLGKLTLVEGNLDNLDLKLSMGDIIWTKGSSKDNRITLNSGDFRFLGDMEGDNKISVDFGDIELNLKGKREDYIINSESQLGDIFIDGGKNNVLGSTKKIDIEVDSGKIHVDFN